MRLIDADALRKDLSDLATLRSGSPVTSGLIQAMYIVHDAPTVEAEPVRHGAWVEHSMYYQCTACKTDFKDDIVWIKNDGEFPKYCPECGAKMDGGET